MVFKPLVKREPNAATLLQGRKVDLAARMAIFGCSPLRVELSISPSLLSLSLSLFCLCLLLPFRDRNNAPLYA